MPAADVPSALARVLAGLQAAGLADHVPSVLDAFWLALQRPGSAAGANLDATVEAPALPSPRQPPREPPADAPDSDAQGHAESDTRSTTLVDVALTPGADGKTTSTAGVYGVSVPGAADGLRARPLRVPGVSALRHASAMALALRPLGKRRRSRTAFEFDEIASVERYAETGALVLCRRPLRERFFSATLLVEDSPSLPLWRGLAFELEELLARQGGFRAMRRYTLAQHNGRLLLRSLSGAWHAPDVLHEDDNSLVLLASDGSTRAWADGRMARLLAKIGRHSSVAVLQWLPEQRWARTALGGIECDVWLPRAGAPNADLRFNAPDWLAPDEARTVLPVPVAALNPRALSRLAETLMAKPGVTAAAALVWPSDAGPAEPSPADTAGAPTATPTPAERIARFERMAGPRVLQAAVQLSAAAPLTLPVVRLVHRVLQPDAPAEDLPLLLLGGLLEARPNGAAAAGAAAGNVAAGAAAPDGDDAIEFAFAPGVRERLQQSLTRDEAVEVRRAVSHYIAERSNSPQDFNALLLDPQGPVSLPAWAQPFAEVTRQVQRLFAPPPAAAPEPALTVREAQWAPGLTVQAQLPLPAAPREIAWARDGRRLAVLHGHGLQVLRLHERGAGRWQWVAEPLALRTPVRMLFIKGHDVPEADIEAAIAAVRDGWPRHFRGELIVQFHTVTPSREKQSQRSTDADLARLDKLIGKPQALVVCIGGPAFFASPWMRAAVAHWIWRYDAKKPPPLLALAAGHGGSWRINRLAPLQQLALVEDTAHDTPSGAETASHALLTLLQTLGSRALPQLAFDEHVASIAWDHQDRLLVADSRRGSIVFEDTLQAVPSFVKAIGRGRRLRLAAHPSRAAVAIAEAGRLRVLRSDAGARSFPLASASALPSWLAWSPDGKRLACRDADGNARIFTVDAAAGPTAAYRRVAVGPIWASVHGTPAYARDDGSIWIDRAGGVELRQPDGGALQSLALSSDEQLLAAATDDADLILHYPGPQRDVRSVRIAIPGGAPGKGTLLTFAPLLLDSGFEALAVAHGAHLTLLRVLASALGEPAPAARPSAPAEWPMPHQVTAAARAVLHAAALTFHVGTSVATGGRVLGNYAERLGYVPGTAEYGRLTVVWTLCEHLFDSAVPQALEAGIDRFREPDLEHGAVAWERACNDALHDLADLAATSPLSEQPRFQLMREVLRYVDPARAEYFGERLSALRSDDPTATQTALSLLKLALLTMLEPDFVIRAAPWADRSALTHHQPYPLFEKLEDFLTRFVDDWVTTLVALDAGGGPDVVVSVATPLPDLGIVYPLARALQLRLQVDPGEHSTHAATWSMPRRDHAALLRFLGAIVATQIARAQGGKPPLAWAVPGLTLLWVDDRPANNEREARSLRLRGFRVLIALSTEEALQLLRRERVDGVLSDLGRPGDRQAGVTLFDTMRAGGLTQPFVLYTGAHVVAGLNAQLRPGLVATSDYHELERQLQLAFVSPGVERSPAS